MSETHKTCPLCGCELLRYNPFNGKTTKIFSGGASDESETYDNDPTARVFDKRAGIVEFCNALNCLYITLPSKVHI